jgi:hypothetical protein
VRISGRRPRGAAVEVVLVYSGACIGTDAKRFPGAASASTHHGNCTREEAPKPAKRVKPAPKEEAPETEPGWTTTVQMAPTAGSR